MKRIILLIFLLLLVVGCNNKKEEKIEKEKDKIIYLDMGIGYEIYYDGNDVIKYIKYKDNNKETIEERISEEDILGIIQDESKDFAYNKNVKVVISWQGNVDIDKFARELNEVENIWFDQNHLNTPTEKDIELSNKYTITPVKATLVNEIYELVKEVSIEKLVNKSIRELLEMKARRAYCPDDYILDGPVCNKEVDTIEPSIGKFCPDDTYEYKGNCYKYTEYSEGTKLVCPTGYSLENNDCVKINIYNAEGECGDGEFISPDKCRYKEDIGEAEEYCYDPNRYLYNHKCLATKPLLNGGCPGNENAKRNGRCVNFENDMQDASHKCPSGSALTPHPNGVFKCEKIIETKPTSYKCRGDDKMLDNNKCENREVDAAFLERTCTSGGTLVNNEVCLNLSEKVSKVDKPYCNNGNQLKDNKCIVYERIDSIQVQ